MKVKSSKNKKSDSLETQPNGTVKYVPIKETQDYMQVCNTGWICPVCGAVMSPTTQCCINCKGNKFDITCTPLNNFNYCDVNTTKSISSSVKEVVK